MKNVTRIMLQGVAAILPAVLTLYILFWLAATTEHLLGGIIQFIWPPAWYWPGMGLLLGVALAYGVGLLLEGWLMQRLLDWSEGLLNRIPLVKTLYGSVKDLIGFFAGNKAKSLEQVVTVVINSGGVPLRLLGFVTRNDFKGLPAGIGADDMVAVYLPMSYQIGGYTVMVPRSAVQTVSMTREQAMRFIITGGMSTDQPSQDDGTRSAIR